MTFQAMQDDLKTKRQDIIADIDRKIEHNNKALIDLKVKALKLKKQVEEGQI